MWKELKDLSIAVFDIETNGFSDNATQVLCSVIEDVHTGELFTYKDSETEDFLCKLQEYDCIIGHNIINFDLPMLKQLCDFELHKDTLLVDTLLLSRLYNVDLEGGHSLGSWGERLSYNKIEYYPCMDAGQPCFNPELQLEDIKKLKKDVGWEQAICTKDMLSYCIKDVRLNTMVFRKLCELLKVIPFQAVECEMLVAQVIKKQQEHGFTFDYKKASLLLAEVSQEIMEIEYNVRNTFKPLPKAVREIQPKIRLSDGAISTIGLSKVLDLVLDGSIVTPEFTVKFDEVNNRKIIEYHSGAFTLLEYPEFSLGSRQQIAERLTRCGYKLTKFTEKGNPIIDDDVLEDAAKKGIKEAKILARYFLLTKRQGMLKDWLERAVWHPEDNVYKIHGYVNTLGAATHRMTHSSPNVAQVPAAKSYLGKECRSLFTVRHGYTLVGCDADGLELRCLAHYMGDPAYIHAVENGKKEDKTDVHNVNMRNAGLSDRDTAKTFIYAFLYGAGDAKIGSIVGGSSADGKRLKARFLKNTPALKALKDKLNTIVQNRPWVKGIDGRILRVRSAHAALNTLLQGMGAIIMKYWLLEVVKQADKQGLEYYPVANIHDEGQFEVKEEHVDVFKQICEEAFGTVTKLLKLKCRVTGSADAGKTWAETH